MKFLRVIALMLIVTGSMSARVAMAGEQRTTAPATQTCTLNITGMTCAGCEAAVKLAARRIDGVKDVKASYERKSAEVTYDPAKTNPTTIAKVISEKSGFKAEVVQKAPKK